ncbi:hypothetical protein LRS03_00795 [Rhizobacter sp. J219]|uniref:hypothetical protein n=1 Tax=Rhizobacter sp. J219 TaxID=2898430 RepID=UPI0021511064|nr:hypothetical protein [Rhizobacter sp. J219]MCR5881480.1 hypothetical protein [Rhizobacter sp. J219]
MNHELDDPRLPAVERLALTRQRLRVALHELSAPPDASQDEGPSVLMTALMAIPGVNVVVDAVRNWWSQHPLHLATLVAGNSARSAMAPLARRSPYGLILAAAAIGGLLYWIKPWRGLLKPALLAGILPHLVSRAMEHVPIESWVSAVSTFAAERMRPGSGPVPDPASPAAAETAATGTPAAVADPDPARPPASNLH